MSRGLTILCLAALAAYVCQRLLSPADANSTGPAISVSDSKKRKPGNHSSPPPMPSLSPLPDSADSATDTTPSLSLLPQSSAEQALLLRYPQIDAFAGHGIHRAFRIAGTWFPVYAPNGDPDEADPEDSPTTSLPLFITSPGPPVFEPGSEITYAFQAIGGSPPYQWQLNCDSSTVRIDAASGQMSGLSEEELDTDLAIFVTDQDGNQDSALYRLLVGSAEALTLRTTELPPATLHQAYEVTLEAVGGRPPYSWQLAESLPDGLQFSADNATLSGVPGLAITQPLTITLQDSAGSSLQHTLSLQVQSAIRILSPDRLPPAPPGSPYQIELQAEGGQLPYRWELIRGQLPSNDAGSTWSLSPAGTLDGLAPTTDSFFSFHLRVTDGAGQSSDQIFSLPVRNLLIAAASNQKVGLAWHPDELREALGRAAQSVTITRSLSPGGGDSMPIYRGRRISHVDSGLRNGVTYYYTLHAQPVGQRDFTPVATTSVTLLPFTKQRGIPGRLADPHADAVLQFQPLSGNAYGSAFLPGNVTGPPDGRGTLLPASDPSQVLSLHATAGATGAPINQHGGSIVLAFTDNIVVAGPGTDFTVFENVFYVNGDPAQRFMEPAIISVALFEDQWFTFPIEIVPPATSSTTPATMDPFYYSRGFAGRNPTTGADPTDPNQSGGDPFDLDQLNLRARGITWIRYIKIQSTGHNVLTDQRNRHPVYHTQILGATSGSASSGFDLDGVTATNY